MLLIKFRYVINFKMYYDIRDINFKKYILGQMNYSVLLFLFKDGILVIEVQKGLGICLRLYSLFMIVKGFKCKFILF